MGREEYKLLRLEVKGRAFYSTLFARAHVSKSDDTDLPAGQTLFLLNVPATATDKALRSAFSVAGDVKKVQSSKIAGAVAGSTTGTRAAHIAFASPDGLKKALAMQEPLKLTLEGGRDSGGAAPKTESREVLQRSVDSLMKKFDAAERRREEEEEARHNTMDGDGCALSATGCRRRRRLRREVEALA